MEARLQRRVQRYGWDLAAAGYEPLWGGPLAAAQTELLTRAAPARGERVLDIACGTGLVSFEAAARVGPEGAVVGIDISGEMVATATRLAAERGVGNARFERMDAEALTLPDGGFDLVLCALGLMYLPEPEAALREMRRVLRPGGRIALAVWGERAKCAWAPVFGIVDEEVVSDVCPLFFRTGQGDTLARLCREAGFDTAASTRISAPLEFHDADSACDAALSGGPTALAWSRFSEEVRARVRARYLEAIQPWRQGSRYRLPGEFVIVTG